MARRHNLKMAVTCTLVLVSAGLFIIILLKLSNTSTADWLHVFWSRQNKSTPRLSAGSCVSNKRCPEHHFSFYMQSGAADVVAPKICVQNKLVLGSVLNNAGPGINVVVLNGKTGAVVQSDHFNMYSDEDKPLIDFLKNIQQGSIVLMASYDDPSTKLTDEAKKLIGQLGSSVVQSLGFRDNWLFVGGKGEVVSSNFEKLLKNDKEKNKYQNWPELIQLEGCIPKSFE
ncbi:protein FAM3C [Entelurus aequoreus]|uniref:protein FAM3C n=1 Tax=Entelurus aequoreus TaxID=161455 RepID=UPI002B1DE501|nr:protein FAM3C [Entelurus aequoreus]